MKKAKEAIAGKVPLCLLLIGAVLLLPASSDAQVRVLELRGSGRDRRREKPGYREGAGIHRWAQGKYVEERAAALPQVTITGLAAREKDESQKLFAPLMAERVQKLYGDVGCHAAPLHLGTGERRRPRRRRGPRNPPRNRSAFSLRPPGGTRPPSFTTSFSPGSCTALALQNEEQKSRHLDEARRRYELGTATDYDVLAAEVAHRNARPEVIRTENQVRTLRERLRYVLALNEEVDAAGSLEKEPVPRPAYELVLRSGQKTPPRTGRPAPPAQHVRRTGARSPTAGDKPRLDARGGYGWRGMEVQNYDTADGPAWSVGVQLSFPIFDGLRTRGRVAQAEERSQAPPDRRGQAGGCDRAGNEGCPERRAGSRRDRQVDVGNGFPGGSGSWRWPRRGTSWA